MERFVLCAVTACFYPFLHESVMLSFRGESGCTTAFKGENNTIRGNSANPNARPPGGRSATFGLGPKVICFYPCLIREHDLSIKCCMWDKYQSVSIPFSSGCFYDSISRKVQVSTRLMLLANSKFNNQSAVPQLSFLVIRITNYELRVTNFCSILYFIFRLRTGFQLFNT